MLKIITDAILSFFAALYQGFISLFAPVTNVVNTIVNGINAFKDFVTPVLEYTLWFFNVPVLVTSSAIVTVSLAYITGEYVVKLVLKYATRLL